MRAGLGRQPPLLVARPLRQGRVLEPQPLGTRGHSERPHRDDAADRVFEVGHAGELDRQVGSGPEQTAERLRLEVIGLEALASARTASSTNTGFRHRRTIGSFHRVHALVSDTAEKAGALVELAESLKAAVMPHRERKVPRWAAESDGSPTQRTYRRATSRARARWSACRPTTRRSPATRSPGCSAASPVPGSRSGLDRA
jgi:hypothetical protein